MDARAHPVPLAALLLGLAALLPARAAAEEVVTNTERVTSMALATDGSLWVATEGGVERYAGPEWAERRLYTTLHGLDANLAVEVGVEAGVVRVRTRTGECTLAGERFACTPASSPWLPQPAMAPVFRGWRVTAELEADGRRVLGTAGGGAFLVDGDAERRLTPDGQICSNHVTDVIAFGGRVWLGTFDEGLCYREGDRYVRVRAPFRMVNDLEVTPRGLHAATSEGLFSSRDGLRWRPSAVAIPGANGLAFDGRSLWVTAPAVLRRLPIVRGAPVPRAFWRPGGSTAVQDVAAGPDGSVWLATEDMGAVRWVGDDRFEIHDRAAGMPTSWALGVDVATDGTAYVATLRHGVVAIDPRGGHRVVTGPSPWMLRVRHEDGALWLGTQGGAASIDDGGRVTTVGALPDGRVHEIRRVGARRYFGTEGGLLVM